LIHQSLIGENILNKARIPQLVGTLLFIFALIFVALSWNPVHAQATTRTILPSDDAYVFATNPTTNYGTAVNLRVDSTPATNSYLRFVVSGLNGAAVTSAKLRLYANSGNTTGYTVNALANNTWTESSLTYSNAPAPGSVLATSAALAAGKWVEVDLSSYIKAEEIGRAHV
jgi:hypothetical protein